MVPFWPLYYGFTHCNDLQQDIGIQFLAQEMLNSHFGNPEGGNKFENFNNTDVRGVGLQGDTGVAMSILQCWLLIPKWRWPP